MYIKIFKMTKRIVLPLYLLVYRSERQTIIFDTCVHPYHLYTNSISIKPLNQSLKILTLLLVKK